MTPPVSLWIDGTRVADGSPGEPAQVPYALSGLTVTWGRATTVDQPDASSATFHLAAQQSWGDRSLFGTLVTLGRQVEVRAGDDHWVFVGSVTDVSMVVPDDDPAGLELVVTADDVLADLGNRPAATSPWPKESVAARFAHVIAAARTGTPYTIATDLAPVQVRKLDVDSGESAMVAELLGDLAVSTDGVLWSTVRYLGPGDPGNGAPALLLESPGQRFPLRRLAYVAPWVTIVDVAASANALDIDACVPLLEPIEFRQTMSDLTTGVSVTYYTPDPADPTGPDLGTTLLVSDPSAESPTRPWGVRRVSVDSQLTSSADAQALAQKLLARLSSPGWRMSNLAIDTADQVTLDDADMLRVLDMRTRIGLPVTITGLPDWVPVDGGRFSGYLEGGELECSQGYWSAVVWCSAAQSYAGVSARYQDIPQTDPNWQYQDVDPDIRYSDLAGVAGPT